MGSATTVASGISPDGLNGSRGHRMTAMPYFWQMAMHSVSTEMLHSTASTSPHAL